MENWGLCNRIADFEQIKRSFGVNDITARLLVNRGLCDEEAIRAYLYPDASGLHKPWLLKDMGKACALLKIKIAGKKKIRVIGDYDVDGIMASYILTDTLGRLGAKVDYRIPERIKDGYGVNINMIEEAANDGIDTILTCDNGIAAIEQTKRAHELGMTIVITDHHDVPEQLPEADALIDIKQADDIYPAKNICGAVVAEKLAEALCEDTEDRTIIQSRYIEYMAMATVCDVMELSGESRTIVKLGLERLRRTDNIGLTELMKLCGIDSTALTAYHIGYVLGPCFNAAGRLDVADKAFVMLTAGNREKAADAAKVCKELNDERKLMTKQQVDKAIEVIESSGDNRMVLVVYLPECHESLAGIIAGRLREQYNRPAFVLTDGQDMIKGSGRSIEGYNMFGELQKCSDLLEKFGGHPMAAGLSLKKENIESFTERLNNECRLTQEDIIPRLLIDCIVPFSMFDERAMKELELLEPFGAGNEKPCFAEKNLQVMRLGYIGQTTRYLKLLLRSSTGLVFDALYFQAADELVGRMKEKYGQESVNRAFRAADSGIRLTAAYYPQYNEYQGVRKLQMVIKSIRL